MWRRPVGGRYTVLYPTQNPMPGSNTKSGTHPLYYYTHRLDGNRQKNTDPASTGRTVSRGMPHTDMVGFESRQKKCKQYGRKKKRPIPKPVARFSAHRRLPVDSWWSNVWRPVRRARQASNVAPRQRWVARWVVRKSRISKSFRSNRGFSLSHMPLSVKRGAHASGSKQRSQQLVALECPIRRSPVKKSSAFVGQGKWPRTSTRPSSSRVLPSIRGQRRRAFYTVRTFAAVFGVFRIPDCDSGVASTPHGICFAQGANHSPGPINWLLTVVAAAWKFPPESLAPPDFTGGNLLLIHIATVPIPAVSLEAKHVINRICALARARSRACGCWMLWSRPGRLRPLPFAAWEMDKVSSAAYHL
ncbi:hypothetical protein FQR65_LT20736 [Abscondita terminalis]|nr:hypothetical protein FQR65_LT20736 [Abscondita terminalis]